MLKILTSKQIKEWDANTIQHEPITSIDLMERACRAFTVWFTEHFEITNKVGVVCGTGNNGGDGLGIARMLNEWGYAVKVWIVRGLVPESEDFKKNRDRLNGKIEIYEIITESDKGLFSDCNILIDAIFGSGLSRSPEGIYAQAIQCINDSNVTRVAVDIPSGLMADRSSSGSIVRAHYTISFQLPKLIFLLPESHRFVRDWTTVNIGLNKVFLKEAKTSHYYLTLSDAKKILRPRQKFDHKGVYGHALLIAGSLGKMGAAVLASRAALRSGLGLLTAHVPRIGYSIIQSSVPEATVSIDEHQDFLTSFHELEKYNAIGIGPGLGQDVKTIRAFATILENFKKPIVIDADGLNILASSRELLQLISKDSILTPHPKEFERLVGQWEDDFERLEKQKQLAIQLKSVVKKKGAYSTIASADGNIYFNSTGNPGMAKGGSGDVLTGILTSLLAQGYSALEAAKLGVYLHGLAGDIAAQEKGMQAMIASDIIESLSTAFLRLVR